MQYKNQIIQSLALVFGILIPRVGIAEHRLSTLLWPHNLDLLITLPRVKAYLDTIAYAEGTYHTQGYESYFGGGYFSNFKDHPRVIMCYMSGDKPLCSTAAGRYQVLERTWDRVRKELKLMDFSPKSQDKLAVALIRDMGALQYVLSGKIKHASKLLHRVWASLPDSQYDQRVIPFKELECFYKKRIAFYEKN